MVSNHNRYRDVRLFVLLALFFVPQILAMGKPCSDITNENKRVRQYSFYDPEISHQMIYEGKLTGDGETAYNHCASLAYFNGQFYCVWDSHKTNYEGRDGQKILLSISEDFIHWTHPVNFVGPGYAENPLITPQYRQWQPNLINYMDKELWCLWYLCSEPGVYLTTLSAQKDAKWVNRKLFDTFTIPADDPSTYAGEVTSGFPSQNPFILSSGRVVAPLTLNGGVIQEYSRYNYKPRWNAVLYTDDHGKTWEMSGLTSNPIDMNGMWEPFVHEQADGKLRMFMRNRTKAHMDPKERMLTTTGVGVEKGSEIIFDPDVQYSGVETLNTRMQVLKLTSGRYAMIMHDVYTKERAYHARLNAALHFSRTGKNDFVAGPGFNRKGTVAMYPQGIEHDGKIYVAYTLGDYGYNHSEPLSIEGAIVDPAPAPDKFYIWPREKDVVNLEYSREKEYWMRKNKYVYQRPQLTQRDGKKVISFSQRGTAGVEIDPVDFSKGQRLTVKFDFTIDKLQSLGNLILCSFGDVEPIRIGMPANRKGFLYVQEKTGFRPVGKVNLNTWTEIEITFTADYFTVAVNGNPPRRFVNPIVHPRPRLYLGDGYEVDYHESNRGSEFVISLDDFTTCVH